MDLDISFYISVPKKTESVMRKVEENSGSSLLRGDGEEGIRRKELCYV